jgi:hypothetical protein
MSVQIRGLLVARPKEAGSLRSARLRCGRAPDSWEGRSCEEVDQIVEAAAGSRVRIRELQFAQESAGAA